jgi:pteridine reductase
MENAPDPLMQSLHPSPFTLHPVALVTGSAVRVGAAIARALAADDYRVIVHYNSSSDAADELVDQIRAGGGEGVALGADLSRVEEVERLAREAEAAWGGVDVLINNASVFPEQGLLDTDPELWEHTMAVNLRAPFFLTQALAPGMKQRGSGVVINLADLAGIQTWTGYAAHGVSKAALIHFTKVAARALAPEIRVNAIAPGTVLPPEEMSDEQVAKLARRAPLERNGAPDDVVGAVRYLLAAEFVTGHVLVLDGGRLLT